MVSVKRRKRRRFHTYIRAWRDFRGLTQDRAAERIGMSRENYSKIESGKVPYNQDFLELCALAFDCTTGDLLTRDPNIERLVDKLNDLLAKESQVSQKRILDVAKTLIENKG